MNKILQLLLAITVGSFAMYIFSAIANFFGMGFQDYGVYMMLAIAVCLFYFILPEKEINIFKEN